MDQSNPTYKQYGFWHTEDECSYWMFFDTLVDAVSDAGQGVQIYEFTGKPIGTYSIKTVLVKSKKKGK